jgi:hypothetical protein
MLKFLRRDPAAYLSLLEVLLVLAVSWGWFGFTADKLPLVMAVASTAVGVVTAVLTKRTGFSMSIGLVKAVIALLAGYGLTISLDQQTAVIGAAVVVLGFFNWTQNEPADDPGLHEEPTATKPVVVNTFSGVSASEADAIAKRATQMSGGAA